VNAFAEAVRQITKIIDEWRNSYDSFSENDENSTTPSAHFVDPSSAEDPQHKLDYSWKQYNSTLQAQQSQQLPAVPSQDDKMPNNTFVHSTGDMRSSKNHAQPRAGSPHDSRPDCTPHVSTGRHRPMNLPRPIGPRSSDSFQGYYAVESYDSTPGHMESTDHRQPEQTLPGLKDAILTHASHTSPRPSQSGWSQAPATRYEQQSGEHPASHTGTSSPPNALRPLPNRHGSYSPSSYALLTGDHDTHRSSTTSYDRPGNPPFTPTGPETSKRYLGIKDMPGEGTFHVYSGGYRIPTSVDGETVNPQWGLTKANKSRKRLALACLDCRERKIRCEPGASSCLQCERAKRVCRQ